MFFYTIEILRDENREIVGRKCLMRTNSPQKVRGKETEVVCANEELDPDFVSVALDENGDMVVSDDTAKRELEAEIKVRVRRQEFGRRLIAIISIRNDLKGFTPEQVVTFATTYATINSALLNGSIQTAKSLIEAIEPDGTITTQGDKDAMIDEIEANEAALGY